MESHRELAITILSISYSGTELWKNTEARSPNVEQNSFVGSQIKNVIKVTYRRYRFDTNINIVIRKQHRADVKMWNRQNSLFGRKISFIEIHTFADSGRIEYKPKTSYFNLEHIHPMWIVQSVIAWHFEQSSFLIFNFFSSMVNNSLK